MNLSTLTSKVGGILSGGLGNGAETGSPSQAADRRGYTRIKVRFVGFLDIEGQRLHVRGIDLHRGGAGISSDFPLPTGALVFLYAKSHGLMGWATVRWCSSRSPSKHQIGLEFRSPLMRAEAGNWQFSWIANSPDQLATPGKLTRPAPGGATIS